MKFQIISDLHLETPAAYDIFQVNPKAPYLALLGDIGHAKDEGLFHFLRRQLELFSIIFLVLGNHEPYHSSWPETKAAMNKFKTSIDEARRSSETLGKLVILDRTRYDVSPDITVLGCTLFSRVTQEQKETVNFGLNDFYHIDDWTIESHQEAHHADLVWLNQQIECISRSEPERKVVVFTHFCPSTHDMVVDPRHKNSKISSAFMTDLSSERCWKNAVVKIWAFGHTHFNCDFQDVQTGKTVSSNQRGYYFAQSEGFDCEKTVEI